MMACPMCTGTDVQHTCDQGQCYWEEMQRQQERWEQEERERWEREQMEEHFRRHPHG